MKPHTSPRVSNNGKMVWCPDSPDNDSASKHFLKSAAQRPASPPTMLRMVPPPRSGEGCCPARTFMRVSTVVFGATGGARRHPSPERGGGTMRSMVGGDAGRRAAEFEIAGYGESFSGESGHQTILPLFETRGDVCSFMESLV